MPIKGFKSLCGRRAACIISKDKGNPQYHRGNNTKGAYVTHYQVDGVIIRTGSRCDYLLLNYLLYLIAKSTNTSEKYGKGNCGGYVANSSSNFGVLSTGTMNSKGVFWGSSDETSPVKVFGIENFWGNIWKSCAGLIYENSVQKIKLAQGTNLDGSSTLKYNLTGEGYLEVEGSEISGNAGGYLSKMKFVDGLAMICADISGSSSTYYCSPVYFGRTGIFYGLICGENSFKRPIGSFCIDISTSIEDAHVIAIGSSLSCKPLAK